SRGLSGPRARCVGRGVVGPPGSLLDARDDGVEAARGRSPPRRSAGGGVMADEGRRQRMFRMEAAGAAALAEAGLFFLPLMEFSAESVKAANGPLRAYGIVAPLFALGVVVGVSVRHFRLYAWAVAAVAGGLAMAQAVRWGDANAPGTVFLVVLSLLVGAGVVSMAGRD